jgi:hypothetical protein
MEYRCPACQRLLYNRRLTRCGFCAAEIPESLRFSKGEIAALDHEMAELQERRLQRQRAAAEEKEARRKRDDASFSGMF